MLSTLVIQDILRSLDGTWFSTSHDDVLARKALPSLHPSVLLERPTIATPVSENPSQKTLIMTEKRVIKNLHDIELTWGGPERQGLTRPAFALAILVQFPQRPRSS